MTLRVPARLLEGKLSMACGKARVAASGSLACAILLAVSCGSSTTPTPPQIMTVLTGVITPGGTASNTFTVQYNGGDTDASINVTSLTTVANGTPVSITIGTAFGDLQLGVCTPYISNPATPLNTVESTSGEPFTAGTYCIQIFDNTAAPTVTVPLNYSVTVTHY
jgi:hypothetical protein